jgi:tetratricopeptide (TPR) repeat protein
VTIPPGKLRRHCRFTPPFLANAMKSELLSLCIAAGLAGLFFLRPAAEKSQTPAAAASTETAADPAALLAALPPAPDSEAGRRRTAAQQKAAAALHDHKAWLSLGDALAQEHRDTASTALFPHAEAAYRHALRQHPRSLEALTGLAWVYGARHEFETSIGWAEQALTIDEKAPAALGIIGDAHLELGHYDEAADFYQRMMDARPDLSSWSRGAHMLWITGDKTKALWLMDKALRAGAPFAENTAWCRARLAMMHFHDGAYLPAKQILEPALTAGSRNAHILLAAGHIAIALGDTGAADGHFRRLIESGPHPEAFAALGDLAAAAGNAAEAESWYKKVEQYQAKHRDTGRHTHLGFARFLADRDRDLKEALRLVEEAKFSKNVLDLDTIAWVFFKNGDTPRAVDAMKRALKHNTPDAAMRYHAGLIAAAAGDTTAARRRLSEALSMNPKFDILHAPRAQAALVELGSVARQ